MNYPPFDLEKALAGEPIAFCRREIAVKKAWLHKGFGDKNVDFIELEDGSILRFSPTFHTIYGMWQEPVRFDNWHLLNENVTAIKRDTAHKWVAIGIMGEPFASYNILTLKPDFFPVCDIGTIIKRPD